MSTHSQSQPVVYPDVQAILDEFLAGIRTILGSQFVGLYLNGSMSVGDFDAYSDIDFIVVTEDILPLEAWAPLQQLHAQLHTSDSPWATHLEGSYYPRHSLRKYDPADLRHPWLEHGQGQLELVDHDPCRGILQRWITREHGLVLAGPSPKTLIDPVTPEDLRAAMHRVWPGWLPSLLADPTQINSRWYQAYIVTCLCRMLYTLQHGTIVSKPVAAKWAEATLDRRWAGLIERARLDRYRPEVRVRQPVDPQEVVPTLEFIRHFIEISRADQSFRANTDLSLLIARIREMLENRLTPVLIALDGRSGSGKSTLSARLAQEFSAVLIHSDDFYIGGEGGLERNWDNCSADEKISFAIDWRRLRREVLEPLLKGQPASYRSFDWQAWSRVQQSGIKEDIGLADNLVTLAPSPLIVLDGVYSTRPELSDLVALKIVVEIPDAERRLRLLRREGQAFMAAWHARWDAAEDRYFTHIRPQSSFDFRIFNH